MTKTLEVFLLPSSSFNDVEKFLGECQNAAEQHQIDLGHKTFMRSLNSVFRVICTKTDLKPVYLRCEIRAIGEKHHQMHIWMMLWSPQCAAIALGVFTGTCFGDSFLVRVIPDSMLSKHPEYQELSQSAIHHLFSLWQPLDPPSSCFSLSYHEVPLKYAVVGNRIWAVSPWITAESNSFTLDPEVVAARAVQYLNLACSYDSIAHRFTGTDVPQYLRIRPDQAEYLMAGYTNNIEAAALLRVHVEADYALMLSPRRLAIHPVKKEGDTCVIFGSSISTHINLDSDEDPLVSFLSYLVTGDDTRYPLADIARGEIPQDLVEKIYYPRRKTNSRRQNQGAPHPVF